MQSTWSRKWVWLLVGVLVVVLARTAMAGERSHTVLLNRSGDGVEVASGDPGDSQVVVLPGRGAWLGVRLAEVTPEKVSELKLKEESGAIVTEVEPKSPAAKAGLQAKDVILEYQGQRVESAAQMIRLVRETPAGRSVRLLVSRNGQRQTFTAQLEQREPMRGEIRIPPIRVPEIHIPPIEVPDFDVEVYGTGPRLGILADALTPQLAEYFGVKQGKGVLVTEVRQGSPAAKAGFKAGDVIVRMNEQAIETVGGLRHALRNKKPGETVTLVVVRQRNEQTLNVRLEEPRRTERPTAGASLDTEELLAKYRASIDQLKQKLQTLREEVQKQLAEKQRALEEHLIRLRQELHDRVSL